MGSDPYLLPGTDCLRNKLGIRVHRDLAFAEARLVSLRDVVLARNPIPGEYDLAHLCAIHKYLFCDVYDWAGQLRKVNIGKPGGIFFGHWEYIEANLASMYSQVVLQNFLVGLSRSALLAQLAHYYLPTTTGRLTLTTPFEKGMAARSVPTFANSPQLLAGALTGRASTRRPTMRLAT